MKIESELWFTPSLFAPTRLLAMVGLSRGRARHTSNRRRPPPGRRIAPPDDRLRRAIQYSETSVMESKSHSVLDTPACAGYDGLVWEHRRRHCLRQTRSVCARERSDEAIHSFFARRDGLLRFARNDGVRTSAPHSQPSLQANRSREYASDDSSAKQSILLRKERMDCFVRSAPRNDGLQ